MVADARLDVIAVAVQHALGDGPILLEHLARLELGAEVAVRVFFLGDEDGAAGVAVEAVDDARPVVAAVVAQLAEVELQGVDQRAAPVPLRRVDDHVVRLVDDRQELVLVEDVERDVFRHREVVRRRRQPDFDVIAVADLVTRLGRLPVDQHAARVDDAPDDRAAVVGEHADQVLVQAHPLHLVLGGQLDGLGAVVRGGRDEVGHAMAPVWKWFQNPGPTRFETAS